MAGNTTPPPPPAIVAEDRVCMRLSGKNAMLLANVNAPSTDDDDEGILLVVVVVQLFVKRGNVSINALKTNGVAMVTPLPASINDMDAMTRCRMAMACRRCCTKEVLSLSSSFPPTMVGVGGQTCRANSLTILQFLR